MYLGIDVGGTHTDAVLCDTQQVFATAKVKTRHDNLQECIHAALANLLQDFKKDTVQIQRITLGTTLGLNALVQGKAAPVGLFVSAGPGMDPLRFVQNTSMDTYVYRVPGGLDHRGQEVTTLNLSQIQKIAKTWLAKGVRQFAIVSKFSPRNAEHENAIAAELLQLSNITEESITLSHNLAGTLNFPRRMAAAYFNAAIKDIQRAFLQAIQASLKQFSLTAPVFMLQADGGAITWHKIYQNPLYSVLSGPCASVMGAMALCQVPQTEEFDDAILLDMGGTTTDIALYAKGIPILDAEGMSIRYAHSAYKTSLRSLLTSSLALGGDHLLQKNTVGTGQALAFGGKEATLLDAFNVCAHAQGLSTVGNVRDSLSGIELLAKKEGISTQTLAQQRVDIALQSILEGIKNLLSKLSGKPVYTLEKLLEGYTLQPKKIYFVGAPAELCAHFLAPFLEKHLHVKVIVPPYSALANALGSALTLPTAQIEFFADTLQGFWHVPTLNLQGRLEKNFNLSKAIELATKILDESQNNHNQAIDVVLAESFAILDNAGRGGKDIRVICQLRPGLVIE